MTASRRYGSNNLMVRRLAAKGLACCLLTGIVGTQAHAGEIPETLQVRGFATQALIATSANNFFGETSDHGNFDFTELGINASLQPQAKLQFAGQILARRAGEGDDGDLRVDYGLADYSYVSNPVHRLGVRAGRILNPLGFYNETRDVAFARPSIFLPQSIYFDRTRDLAISADGLQFYGDHRIKTHELFWQVGTARPRVDAIETERAIFGGANMPGKLSSDTSLSGQFLWESDGGRFRAALSAFIVKMGYEPGAAPPADLLAGDVIFKPTVSSLQYLTERWTYTAEYARRKFQHKDFGAGLPDQQVEGESWYLQAVHHWSNEIDLIGRYDVLYTDVTDRDGRVYEAAKGGAVPHYSRFAKDATVGLGWQATQSLLLRAEFHRVNGTAWLPAADNPLIGNTVQHWNMFSLLASYRF